MGFLNQYLDKHRLDKMPKKMKKKLDKLEKKLQDYVAGSKGKLSFEDIIKEFGPQIADLVERVSQYKDNMPPITWRNALSIFRFVQSIATEVFQIVEAMKDAIVDGSMSEEEQRQAKVEFGTELVYFIWMTVDPLKGKFTWLPFKKALEKMIVKWLAGMAMESLVDLFIAQGAKAFGIQKSPTRKGKGKKKFTIAKALPQ